MEKLAELITKEVSQAFAAVGLDGAQYGRVTVSNRPDLCEYQCNGAMPAAKVLGRAPLSIAEEVASHLKDCPAFARVEAAKPGFLNLTLSPPLSRPIWSRCAPLKSSALQVPRSPKPLSLTTAAPMWPSPCMWATCALLSLARASSESIAMPAIRLPAISIWATGAYKSA